MNNCPVVLVHGLFGWGPGELPFPYWGTGTQVPSPMPIFEANVGPISSFHDRACELIAQIKGLQVDYGEEHAKLNGHARFGKDFSQAGFYPQWDAGHPVHLVGHSAGGNTMRVAQHLLAIDFHQLGSDSSWIKSISAVSAVLNGTPLVYMLGCDPKTGLVRPTGMGGILSWAIKQASLSHAHKPDSTIRYDLDLAHWHLNHDSSRSPEDRALLLSSSALFQGTDNLAYDLSMQGCYGVNAYAQTYPGTYYFGYATERTHKGPLTGQHYPNPLMSALLIPAATYQGWYQFGKEPPFPEWGTGQLVDALWWANDGCVPTISQYYPFINSKTVHPVHPVRGIQTLETFEPGVWYHEKIEDATGCQWDHFGHCLRGISRRPQRAHAAQFLYRAFRPLGLPTV
jgi:triacylglycerol lipase